MIATSKSIFLDLGILSKVSQITLLKIRHFISKILIWLQIKAFTQIRINGYYLICPSNYRINLDLVLKIQKEFEELKLDLLYFDEIVSHKTKNFYIAKPIFSPIYLNKVNYIGELFMIEINFFREHIINRKNLKDLSNDLVISILNSNSVKVKRINQAITNVDFGNIYLNSFSLEVKPKIYQKLNPKVEQKVKIKEINEFTIVIPSGLKKLPNSVGNELILDRLLREIDETLQPEEDKLEVIIVLDNDLQSINESFRIKEQYKNMVTQFEFVDKPFVFSKKINAGMSLVNKNKAIILNDDIYNISPNWIQEISDCFQTYQSRNIGAIGVLLKKDDGSISHLGISCLNEIWQNYREGSQLDTRDPVCKYIREVSGVTAAFLAVDLEAFNKVGGFDPAIINQFDDLDFMLKLNQAGYKVLLNPKIQATHSGSLSIVDARIYDNKEVILQKWGKISRDDYFLTNSYHYPELISHYFPKF